MERRYAPVYLAYCRSQGHEPEEQKRIDTEKFMGGQMTGFTIWCSQRSAEFRESIGCQRNPCGHDHRADYQQWLDAWVARERAGAAAHAIDGMHDEATS